jgi:NADPH-dependent glutamate synthase beta subunit-like oxidoreductase
MIPISRKTTEAFKTGTWSSDRPHFGEKISPCRAACPTGNNISAAARAAADGDYDEALAAFLEETPLPGSCGRVCYHPCQFSCNRMNEDGWVNIRALERAAADYGNTKPKMLSEAGKDKPVAVVGSGPAGLSCAYHLARTGHPVTIFEAADKAGGLLARGIPGFRLPEEVLNKDLDRIWSLGVVLKTGVAIDMAKLEELAQSHEAIFLSPGADKHQALDVPGEDLDGVLEGLGFLRDPGIQARAKDSNVFVIGGGNTAIDAARTALRAGAENVTILYRRSKEQMPAFKDEVLEAETEGILIKELVVPTAFLGERKLTGVKLAQLRLGEPGPDGRPKPIVIEGPEEEMTCDLVIVAAGQKAEETFMSDDLRWEDNRIYVDDWNRTSNTKIFAGGDLTPARASVVDAIATGKRAALGIHLTTVGNLDEETLKEVTLGNGPSFSITACFQRPEGWHPAEIASPDEITLRMIPTQEPESLPEADAVERVRTNEEVAQGLSIESATKEAKRCLVCGTCVGCDRCLIFCPEGIVIPPEKAGGEYLYRNEFCKGCGVCASVCLRGVMETGGIK